MRNYLTLEELRRFFSKVDCARDYLIFLLGYRHGLRVSEVCCIRTSDIDLQASRIYLHRLKGSVSTQHILPGDESEKIQSLSRLRGYSHSPYLFLGRNGGCISRKTIDKMMKRYGKLAKLPASKCHFHILKHSIAVHMLEAGADIKLVQELLGHKNIQNTLVYAQLVSSYRDAKQIELFKSPNIF